MGGWGCTTGRSGPDCTVGPRSGRDCNVPDRAAPSGPDRGPTQSGPVNCTKLAHHGTIGARLHRRAPIGLRLRRRPDRPRLSGRDCAVTRSFALQGGILSNTGGKDGPGAFREDSGRVWCCWGYRPSLCFFCFFFFFTRGPNWWFRVFLL